MHLDEMPPRFKETLLGQELPEYDDTPCVAGPPLSERRIAIITTAGLHRRSDPPFAAGVAEYRLIPGDTDLGDLIMSHVSTNFDRSGFLQDFNTVLPIDRLRELADEGAVGSVADYHFAFMGATPPTVHEAIAKDVAASLKGDNVDGVLLAGV